MLAGGGVMRRAHVAQSVEHFLGKEEVTGSSPVVGSGEMGRRRDGGETEWAPIV